MKIIKHDLNSKNIAELISDTILIKDEESALNLLGELYFEGFDALLIYQNNFIDDFFKLKNGLAGEILQKFSNYRMKLAIVGQFEQFNSQSLNEFIYESNKNGHVYFVSSRETGIELLAKN